MQADELFHRNIIMCPLLISIMPLQRVSLAELSCVLRSQIWHIPTRANVRPRGALCSTGGTKLPILQNGSRKNAYCKKHLPQKRLLQKHLLQKHLLQKTSAAKTSTSKMSPESKHLRNFRVYCGHKSDIFQLTQMCDLAERFVVQEGTKLPIFQNGSRKNACCKKHLPPKCLLQKHLPQNVPWK